MRPAFFPRLACRAAVPWLLLTAPGFVPALRAAPPVSPPQFERDVRPILTAHCLKCHGLEMKKAALDLRTVALMLGGGDSGPAIVKGSAAKSPLFTKIAERSMPPKKELPLTEAQIETVRQWLDAGAPAVEAEVTANHEAALVTDQDRQFWAFQKLSRPPVPRARDAARVRTPVDAFLLAKLEERGLTFSAEADRQTLIRRASFDLIGLSPTPEEVRAFLADDRPGAYERLVNRLLASPHFGERWGRHWLDAAGYVDTIGDDTDATIAKVGAGKWRYRDYVIRSVNDDKPFDRFLVEQLAGDELVNWRAAEVLTPEMQQLLVATGFLRTAADETLQDELNTADIRHAVLQHTVEVVVSNVLGLTVNCARCHSHKFDPVPQEDYYRLLAFFTPAYNPQHWLTPGSRQLPDVSRADRKNIQKHNQDIDRQVAERKGRLDSLRRPHEERLRAGKLALLPEPIRADTQAAVQTPAEKRTEVQKYLAAKLEGVLKVSPDEVAAALSAAERAACQQLKAEVAGLNARRRSWGAIQAVYDVGPPPATYLLRRGNHETPGYEVAPGFLRVLCPSESAAAASAVPPFPGTSGRRLALARWLTAPDTPASALAARVYVNRVWQHLFGQGIVVTSDNLGKSGAQPTHPELLDWLAGEFARGRGRLKPLLKVLVTSSAYRQASKAVRPPGRSAGDPGRVDPGNALLWRMRLRQLESEAVRDSILAVSGQLDRAMGGPADPHEVRADGAVVVKRNGPAAARCRERRSVYVLARRRYHVSLLETFDQPEMAGNCPRRVPSAVVSQSLTLLNDPQLVEHAGSFAERVTRDVGDAPPEVWVDRAFAVALGRPPRPEEKDWSLDLLRRQAARFRTSAPPADAARQARVRLCHMLLNANEFLYVP